MTKPQTQVDAAMLRPDLLRIAQWIEPGSRVLDLGCNDGTLLAHLRDTRQVVGTGVELNDQFVIASVRRGVNVIQQDLEKGLALFSDQPAARIMAMISSPAPSVSDTLVACMRVKRSGMRTRPIPPTR